ncbi:MAG: lipopolysaccharide kinase InaA family protein [Planctomycetes bacterium]|nr:lipopolysaccharide kinase InaA family protein [Planctomycetota bacterium]
MLTSRRRFFASPAVRTLLVRAGLGNIDAAFDESRSRLASTSGHRGRKVLERTLPFEDGRVERVFVKLYRNRPRLWPRIKDLRTGQAFQSLPLREWRGLARLARLGLCVSERLALYQDGLWWRRAAVVVRAVPGEGSLDEWLASGRWQRLGPRDRGGILDAVVEATCRIHAAGLGWRGASSRHYYPVRSPEGNWRVWLIDCEGVHGRAHSSTFARDWKKLLRSMKESGADDRTLNELTRRIAARRAFARRAA